jgi:amino-acid N-acetyltransferase
MDIEKAKISDVPQMHWLINQFADKGEMLPRPMSELYENIRDFFVARDNNGEMVACVALHVIWGDLAEIKALAVAEGQQEQGIGAALLQACLDEAKELGIPRLFCLTYQPSFFEQFGFGYTNVMELPRKIWGECQRCPKFPHCDETAMVLDL